MRLRFSTVAALIAAFALLPSIGASAAAEPIVVGVVISTSGPSAPLGVPQKNAFAIVEKDVNDHGGIAGRPDGRAPRHLRNLPLLGDRSQRPHGKGRAHGSRA